MWVGVTHAQNILIFRQLTFFQPMPTIYLVYHFYMQIPYKTVGTYQSSLKHANILYLLWQEFIIQYSSAIYRDHEG